jgi:hypothetical protein
MPGKGYHLRLPMLTTLLALAAPASALAQLPPQPPPVANPFNQGNEQERAACRPDVMKFCHSLVKDDSDVLAILGCLQTNRSRISAPCQEVLASHGQ